MTVFKKTIALLLFISAQVKSLSWDELKDIRKACAAKYPNKNENGADIEAQFDFCVLLATKVMDSNGEIDTENLRNLLETEYGNGSPISEVVALCAVKQSTPLATAFFLTESCWFDGETDLSRIKNSIISIQCSMPQFPTFETDDSTIEKTIKCEIEKSGVIDENGVLNKDKLSELLDDLKPSEKESLLNCVDQKDSKSDIIQNIYECSRKLLDGLS